MVFSSYGNSSSFYLPLDSDQGVTFYKNENSLFSPQPPTSVVCQRNQDNASSAMSPNELLPFGNNSHGTVVVDAVRQDFQPVAHLSSNGYYGYVPPPKVMSTAAVNAATVNTLTACSDAVQLDCQTEDAAMDCGEMENFHQLQHQRKRKQYSEEVTAVTKRRKTWLEEERQAAAFPQSFGWNQLPYAHGQLQMDCATEDSLTNIGSYNGPTVGFQFQPTGTTPVPVATVTIPQQPPKNPVLVDGNTSNKRHSAVTLGRWNIAMPTSRPNGTGCSAVGGHRLLLAAEDSELSAKLHHQQSVAFGFGGGQELEDLFVSLHGSGFFLAG
uniref:Uncharacterized protein n=1 Tax=Culex tarsalis TaxID=7177 RepID=A0A1Q3FW01_CULTA